MWAVLFWPLLFLSSQLKAMSMASMQAQHKLLLKIPPRSRINQKINSFFLIVIIFVSPFIVHSKARGLWGFI